ncbi:MAG: hypothetical protein JOZ92_07090 [Candidatus Dormibacteraeota bacterium]|nr:hypothetical protein [Candidatus Dormibacteraeota bacterium]
MNAAFPAALAGSADTALFLARRPGMFRSAPGRAAGSVAFLVLWSTLATRTCYEADGPPSAATLALAGVALSGNLAILAAHLRRGVAAPRIFLGSALSAAVLADCLRRR